MIHSIQIYLYVVGGGGGGRSNGSSMNQINFIQFY